MSNRNASAIDEELAKALDPTQDAQVIQWDNVTAHIEGQQITFVTGSATLVPIDDESTRDGFDEPIASSAEVLAASTPADCLAPMKPPRCSYIEISASSMNAMAAYIEARDRLHAEEFAAVISTDDAAAAAASAPQTPSPKKSSGYEENTKCYAPLKRSDSSSNMDPLNPFFQGCGGKIDFDSAASDSAAYSDSLLTKKKRDDDNSITASESSKKRFRCLEEAEKEFVALSRYAQQMEEQYLKCLNKDLAVARANEQLFLESSRQQRALENAAHSVLSSVFESFPSGYDRAEWLRGNLDELRTLAEIVGLDNSLQSLLQDEDIHSDDSDDDSTTDGGNSDAL